MFKKNVTKQRYPNARFVASELRALDLGDEGGAIAEPKCHLIQTRMDALDNIPCASGETNCPICLNPIDDGRPRDELACKHRFHHECIGTWFGGGNYSCPMCRTVASDADLAAHNIVAPAIPEQFQGLADRLHLPPQTIFPDDFDEELDFDFRHRIASNNRYSGWPRLEYINPRF